MCRLPHCRKVRSLFSYKGHISGEAVSETSGGSKNSKVLRNHPIKVLTRREKDLSQ